jgi:hypothetical protein
MLLLLLSCAAAPVDDSDSGVAPLPPLNATLRLLNAQSGAGIPDLSVQSGDVTGTSDADGVVTLELPAQQPFAAAVTGDEVLPHLLMGETTDQDFEFVTFVGTPTLTNQVLRALDTRWTAGTAMVVVGVDYADLSPVAGAQAQLDVDGEAFVLGARLPAWGDTIPERGVGMVSFLDVPVGAANATVTPPEGVACTTWPGGRDTASLDAVADTVTVVLFRCE